MRFGTAALSLIMLTKLDGTPIWVESTQVFIIQHSKDCAQHSTTIAVGGRALCVKESIDQVREKIKKGNEEHSW